MKKLRSYFIVTASIGALAFPFQVKAMVPDELGVRTKSFSTALPFSINQNRMDASIKGLTLGEVLKQFSQLAKVNVTVSQARAQQRISVNFKDLPIQEGIQRILSENYTLVYDASELPKLTDVRIVNDITGANTVAGKTWIKYSPVSDMERGLRDQDEFTRLNFLEKIQKQDALVNLSLLSEIALNDENTHVRQLALQKLAKRIGSKKMKQILTQVLNEDTDANFQSFAQSLLEQLENEGPYNLVNTKQVANNSTGLENFKLAQNDNVGNENSPTPVKENLQTDTGESPTNQPKENTPEVVSDPQQQPENEENSEEPKQREEINPYVDFKQKLANDDPQILEDFTSADYPNDLRMLAIDEIVELLGYQAGYEYLKQKVATETDSEILEFVKVTGNQRVTDAKWILKIDLDRSPFEEKKQKGST